MRKTIYKSTGMLLAALMLGTVLPPGLHAQDAAFTTVNDHVAKPWVNGSTFTGTITSSGSGWTSPEAVASNSNADYASVGYTSPAITGGTFTTPYLSVINTAQVFNTTPFTGYWVGVEATRTKSGAVLWNGLSTNRIIIATYLNGVAADSSTLDWNGGSGNTVDANVGFYAHKPFNEVRVRLTSSVTGTLTSVTGQQRLKTVYLKRFTRQAGGFASGQATANAQIPVTGFGLRGQGLATSLGIPPYIVPALGSWVESIEDEDPGTHATVPYLSGFALGTNYQGSIKDSAVVYPAGTFGGMKISIAEGLMVSAADVRTISLLRNGNVVASVSSTGLLGAGILSDDGSTVVGVVSPVEFDEIAYSFTTLFSPPGVGAGVIYYPVVQRFSDNPLACTPTNGPVKLIAGVQNGATNYPVYVTAEENSFLGVNAKIRNLDYIIDANLNNYASISSLASGISDMAVSVHSQESAKYPAGTFYGFEIKDVSLGSATALSRHIVEAFRNGVRVDYYDDGGAAASAMVFTDEGRVIVGKKSSQSFDEIRISVQTFAGAGLAETQVYGAVVEKFCVATNTPVCNGITLLNRSVLPVYIDGRNTGTSGNSALSLNHQFKNLNNVIDANTSNYAELITTAGLSTNVSLAVQDGSKGIGNPGDASYELYPAGTFAGFDVSFPTVASLSFLNDVQVSLLGPSGNVLQTESLSGNLMGLYSSLLSGNESRQTLGFVANVPFSGIKFSASKVANATWGSIKVFGVVTEKFCQGPAVACSELDTLSAPAHPLYINGVRTGIFSGFDGNAGINNSGNAIDADANSYAELQVGGATALSTLGFSVANGYDSFAAKTFVGFDMSTQNWFDVNALTQTKIELYYKDSLVQTSTGNQMGAGVSSDLVTGGWKRGVVGTVARHVFDEARIVISRLAGASVGVIRIHNFVARSFDPVTASACSVRVECDKTYPLTDNDGSGPEPTIPAVVEFDRTGYTGVVAGGYGIDKPWSVVSPADTDYATIHLPAAGGTTGSISVATPGVVFPAGTHAGFSVDKQNFIISGGLFTGVTITTYLNGVQQESKTDAALVDFTLLSQWFGTPANFYTPGFQTLLPFNEVRITIGGLVSGLDQTLKIYGAYVDTRNAVQQPGDGTTPLVCGADLTPGSSITNPVFTINAGTNRNFIINVSEIIGKSTTNATNPVYVRITKSSNFDYSFNPLATSLSGTAVNNANWSLISSTSSSMTFQLNSNVEIPAYGISKIGINLQVKPAATAGTINATITILNASGGDINNDNNISIRQLLVQ